MESEHAVNDQPRQTSHELDDLRLPTDWTASTPRAALAPTLNLLSSTANRHAWELRQLRYRCTRLEQATRRRNRIDLAALTIWAAALLAAWLT